MAFSGLHKLEAALAAIQGGNATHLIVDERSGSELLKAA
jgi:DNA-binding transcriptional regulator LsrR (DeoR family)